MLSPLALSMALAAQVLLGGSTGDRPPFAPTANVVLDVPDGGRFEFSTITVPAGVTVRFNRNQRNDPVLFLAQGAVVINGIIDVSGEAGPQNRGGAGGPGGYDGGAPGFGGTPGGGHGPGGGVYGGTNSAHIAAAAHSTRHSNSLASLYGAQPCFPLVGGSGGAGWSNTQGGGGGGGAILIASEGTITIAGTISASAGSNYGSQASGSGGTIRIVSPKVVVTGTLYAGDGTGGNNYGGFGYVRIDSIDKTEIAGTRTPAAAPGGSIGTNMVVELPTMPAVNLVAVAGFPTNGQPYFRTLPPGSSEIQQVDFELANFPQCISVRIRVVPSTGPAIEPPPFQYFANGPYSEAVTIPGNTATAVEVYAQGVACPPQ